MTYSLNSDIRREFKSVLDQGTVITDDKIIEFQLQMYALINSYLATRYTTPITGTAPVNQVDTITPAPSVGAAEVRYFKTLANGVNKTYSYTTTGAQTSAQISDALLTLLNADVNRIVEGEVVGDDLVIQSRVMGYEYALTVGSDVSFINNTAAVIGSNSLRLLRKIETELTACKIAGILRTKIADKLQASGVRQDIKDESTCGKQALAILKDLQNGTAALEDAVLASSTGGLESSAYAGTWKKDVRQW